MPAKLSEVLSGATTVFYDSEHAPAGCTVRQLAPYQQAQQQRRVEPLRPLLHKLR